MQNALEHLEDDNSSVWVLDCSIKQDSYIFAQNAEPLWIDLDLQGTRILT